MSQNGPNRRGAQSKRFGWTAGNYPGNGEFAGAFPGNWEPGNCPANVPENAADQPANSPGDIRIFASRILRGIRRVFPAASSRGISREILDGQPHFPGNSPGIIGPPIAGFGRLCPFCNESPCGLVESCHSDLRQVPGLMTHRLPPEELPYA